MIPDLRSSRGERQRPKSVFTLGTWRRDWLEECRIVR